MIPTAANAARRGRLLPRRRRHVPGVRARLLTVTEAGIARILVFGDGPGLVARFGLPATLPASYACATPVAHLPCRPPTLSPTYPTGQPRSQASGSGT